MYSKGEFEQDMWTIACKRWGLHLRLLHNIINRTYATTEALKRVQETQKETSLDSLRQLHEKYPQYLKMSEVEDVLNGTHVGMNNPPKVDVDTLVKKLGAPA